MKRLQASLQRLCFAVVVLLYGYAGANISDAYHGDVVLRIVPNSAAQLQLLQHMRVSGVPCQVDVWRPPSCIGCPVDVRIPNMVDGHALARVFAYLDSIGNMTANGGQVQVLIDDVQRAIVASSTSIGRSRKLDSSGYPDSKWVEKYHDYYETLTWARQLTDASASDGHGQVASMVYLGGKSFSDPNMVTHEGKLMFGVLLTAPTNSRFPSHSADTPPVLYVDSGIHAVCS